MSLRALPSCRRCWRWPRRLVHLTRLSRRFEASVLHGGAISADPAAAYSRFGRRPSSKRRKDHGRARDSLRSLAKSNCLKSNSEHYNPTRRRQPYLPCFVLKKPPPTRVFGGGRKYGRISSLECANARSKVKPNGRNPIRPVLVTFYFRMARGRRPLYPEQRVPSQLSSLNRSFYIRPAFAGLLRSIDAESGSRKRPVRNPLARPQRTTAGLASRSSSIYLACGRESFSQSLKNTPDLQG
jgi:hypothetical protein